MEQSAPSGDARAAASSSPGVNQNRGGIRTAGGNHLRCVCFTVINAETEVRALFSGSAPALEVALAAVGFPVGRGRTRPNRDANPIKHLRWVLIPVACGREVCTGMCSRPCEALERTSTRP